MLGLIILVLLPPAVSLVCWCIDDEPQDTPRIWSLIMRFLRALKVVLSALDKRGITRENVAILSSGAVMYFCGARTWLGCIIVLLAAQTIVAVILAAIISTRKGHK
jgi:hypothetical protein